MVHCTIGVKRGCAISPIPKTTKVSTFFRLIFGQRLFEAPDLDVLIEQSKVQPTSFSHILIFFSYLDLMVTQAKINLYYLLFSLIPGLSHVKLGLSHVACLGGSDFAWRCSVHAPH